MITTVCEVCLLIFFFSCVPETITGQNAATVMSFLIGEGLLAQTGMSVISLPWNITYADFKGELHVTNHAIRTT